MNEDYDFIPAHDYEANKYDNYYLHTDTDGEFIKYRSPFAINFFRLETYKYWELEKAILFEALLHLYRNLGNDFYYQKKRFFELTKLKRYKFDKYLKELQDDGYVTVTRKGEEYNFKNYYKINFDTIIDDLDQIYDLTPLDVANEIDSLKKLYIVLFQYEKFRFEDNVHITKKGVLTRYKERGEDVEQQINGGGMRNYTNI